MELRSGGWRGLRIDLQWTPTFVPESPAFAQEYRISAAGLFGEYTNVRIPALAKVLFACVLALGTLLVSAQTSDHDQPYRPQVQCSSKGILFPATGKADSVTEKIWRLGSIWE